MLFALLIINRSEGFLYLSTTCISAGLRYVPFRHLSVLRRDKHGCVLQFMVRSVNARVVLINVSFVVINKLKEQKFVLLTFLNYEFRGWFIERKM